jgi:uncharacterized protein
MNPGDRDSVMRKRLLPVLLCLLAFRAAAQDIEIPAGLDDKAALSSAMPALAKSLIARQDALQSSSPDWLFRAQLVAGSYRDALNSLDALRAPLIGNASPRVRSRYWEYILYAQAGLRSYERKISFDAAYREAFHALVNPLDDRTSAPVINRLSYDNLSEAEPKLLQDLEGLKGKNSISLTDAVGLIGDYNEVQVYRAFGSNTASLIAADDAHRYTTQTDIRVHTPGAGTICVLIVRPVRPQRLPALLLFTIYNEPGTNFREARRSASNGYAAVIGLTRGKGCSPDAIVPYEHDGADAASLIDWIAAQSWSDGQVGMYGGSYSGFTTWAAAKYHPKALKAIMVGAPNAPGIDSPMEGNVFWNFIYPWPFYVANNKTLDNATYNQHARWERLDRNWYMSGRAYQELDKIDGTANPIFERWLQHPSYDAYWQRLIPYRREFAEIDMPVLETAGYYAGGPGAAVYYLSQHTLYKPGAQHYLIIGPYDHFTAQRGTASADGEIDEIAGYPLDAAAHIDLVEFRYRWFDYTLRGGPKPDFLADKINYEVTGANLWKHAPSIAAMSATTRRFYLSADAAAGQFRLSPSGPAAGSINQSVDFAIRRDADLQAPGGGFQDKQLDTTNGLVFISEPLAASTEMSGLFSGRLEFTVNKKDFDFQISLFELTPAGDYFQLAPYWSRASHVGDLTARRLLVPGKRQSLDFRSMRLMSRKLAAHSRLVMVLSIIKEPGREINYGTGGTVSEETIADAKVPLKITWFSASHIDVPWQ